MSLCIIGWSRPEQVNGVLEFYSVYLSVEGEEPVCVYNSSELFEDHTLRNLTPGTTYSFTVSVKETTPENIPAPYVTPLSPHALNITWTPPDTPNGKEVGRGRGYDEVKGGKRGVERRTLEMAPVGPVVLELREHRITMMLGMHGCSSCGAELQVEDGHDLCPTCLGVGHLHEALSDPCINCAIRPVKVREAQLARVEGLVFTDNLPASGIVCQDPPRTTKRGKAHKNGLDHMPKVMNA
ncbi:unnamed protein product [Coregonus sp. 'balchen']|nr:unnamed protein product [Coregonus sp. 'balchen']